MQFVLMQTSCFLAGRCVLGEMKSKISWLSLITILGNKAKDEVLDITIRYQLLTACAGALCEAERSGYSRALMLVHEFFTDKTNDIRHRRNGADLNTFVLHISDGRVSNVEFGLIYGPFRVPGLPIVKNEIDLFVGKVSRKIRTGG